MLEVKNIFVNYGAAPALWDVSIEVQDRELVCVVGPNGAGKTTLINAIAGLHAVKSGQLMFQGKDITRLESHRFCEAGIAIVPEGRRLFTQMTVMDGGSFAQKAALWQVDDDALYRHARSARERKIIRDTVSFLRSGGAQPRYRPEEEMDAQSDALSGVEDVSPSTLYPPHGRRGTYTEPDAEGFRTVTRRTRAKPRTLTEAELARKYRAEFFGEEDEEEEDVNGDLTDRNQRRDFY
jgi:ABC-type sugar transport system ATPase subunit